MKVMVNNVTKIKGVVTATNVLLTSDMELMPVSITPHGSYKKASVCQFLLELVDPLLTTDWLCGCGCPDIIVDYEPDSIFKKFIFNGFGDGASYIFSSASNSAHKLKKIIKGLGTNIFLLPNNASEKNVLDAIRFLFQKKCDRKFGRVFFLADMY